MSGMGGGDVPGGLEKRKMKVKGTGLMAKVMIVSYNVKGLNHPAKRKKM